MTGVADMLNVTLGMKGNSSLGTSTGSSDSLASLFAADGLSFDQVLGQTFSYANNTSNTTVLNDANAEETTDITEIPDEVTVSFAELTTALKDAVGDAGDDVINAAVAMLKSVGKAVEKLFGTGSSSVSDTDSGEKLDSTAAIFGMLVKNVSTSDDSDSDEVSDELSELLSVISDTLDSAVTEKKDTADVVSELKKALARVGKSDDDDDDDENTTLTDEIMALLCSLSGIDVTSEDFSLDSAEENITSEALAKLSDIADTLSSDKTPEEKTDDIVKIVSDSNDEVLKEDIVKFADYIGKNKDTDLSSIVKSFGGFNTLKINNVSSQLDNIGRQNENAALLFNGASLKPQQLIEDEDIFESTEDVFKELGEFVNVQLTENITDEISSADISDGVKELTVVLKPENLGEVAIKLTTDANGAVSIVLSASNAEVNRAISENAAALSENLSKQNLDISDINVVNPSEASSYMGLDFTNQGFNRKNDSYDTDDNNSSNDRRSSVSEITDVESDGSEVRAQRLLKEARLWATA